MGAKRKKGDAALQSPHNAIAPQGCTERGGGYSRVIGELFISKVIPAGLPRMFREGRGKGKEIPQIGEGKKGETTRKSGGGGGKGGPFQESQ